MQGDKLKEPRAKKEAQNVPYIYNVSGISDQGLREVVQ